MSLLEKYWPKRIPKVQTKWDLSTYISRSCDKTLYVASTGTPFQRRFNEYFQSFSNYNSNSIFAQHLHEMEHSNGPMEETVDTLHTVQKGNYMNILEKCHIYLETKRNQQISDESTVGINEVFNVRVQQSTSNTSTFNSQMGKF